MRISDWSSDVCSSDLSQTCRHVATLTAAPHGISRRAMRQSARSRSLCLECKAVGWMRARLCCGRVDPRGLEVRNERSGSGAVCNWRQRSEEHTSELQSLMRISYADFSLNNTTISN